MTSSTSNQESISQLVVRIQAGDPKAEAELVGKYCRSISLLLRQKARNLQDVEDLFQDTFRIAIEKIRKGELRHPGRLSSFLVSTARFTAIDYYRREGKHQHPDEPLPEMSNLVDNPLLSMINREDFRHILKSIPELKSTRDRDILMRFYIAKEEKATICREMSISSGTFYRILSRAKKRLKDLLLRGN